MWGARIIDRSQVHKTNLKQQMLTHGKRNDTATFFSVICFLSKIQTRRWIIRLPRCVCKRKKQIQSSSKGCSQQVAHVWSHHMVNNSKCSRVWDNQGARLFISTFYGSLITKWFQMFDGRDIYYLQTLPPDLSVGQFKTVMLITVRADSSAPRHPRAGLCSTEITEGGTHVCVH